MTEKEHVNEHRLILMEKAIKNIKALDPKEYDRQVCTIGLCCVSGLCGGWGLPVSDVVFY